MIGKPKNLREVRSPSRPRRRRRWLRAFGILLLGLILLLAAARPFLPGVIRWYVNRALDRSRLYHGRIGDVTVHLLRGAYAIHDLRLVKTTGVVPVPLLKVKTMELSVQWDALLHGRAVGQVTFDQPELNFVDAPSEGEAQNGVGGPWLAILRDLFPFRINRTQVVDGSVHFRTYQQRQPVDVYLSHLEATVDNVTNIRDETTPLVTTVDATALAMDQGQFEMHMQLDPFSYNPSFHLATRLVGLDVTKTNDLVRAYGQFQFRSGFFDLVLEVTSVEGQMTGYIKPLFRQLSMFDLPTDLAYDKDPLQFFWQILLGVTTSVLKNQPRDQFGTLIPFTADSSGSPSPDILQTVGNVLRNGFVRAYLPRLEPDLQQSQDIQFSPGSIQDLGINEDAAP